MQEDNYYIAAGLDWPEGTVISEATFAGAPHKSFFVQTIPSHLQNNPDFMARRKTELKLEEYRIGKCAGKPSRSNAVFLNKTLEDAIKWRNRGTRASYNIYELSVRDEQNSTEVNYIWYNYCVRLQKAPQTEFRRIFTETPEGDFAGSIRAYWDNRPTDDAGCPTEIEILYVGTLDVVKRIA